MARQLQNIKVSFLGNIPGFQFAAKILTDRGAQVLHNDINQHVTLFLTDHHNEARTTNADKPVIVLKDCHIGIPHLLALSGHLSTFGQLKDPFYAKYLGELLLGNSMTILCLQHLSNSQAKTRSYVSVLDLVKYFGAFNISSKLNGMMENQRGNNILDGGAPFYSLYKCKQGWISVGNLEPKFYKQMLNGLKLTEEEYSLMQEQFNTEKYPEMRRFLTAKFLTKTAIQWQKIMHNFDTCVTLVSHQLPEKVVEPRLTALSAKL